MSDNLAAVLYGIDDLRLEQRPMPKAKKGQLLVRVSTVGICGSDVHFLKRGRIGSYVMDGPMVLGHETSGVVESVGEGVEGFQKGDRIALEPPGLTSCKNCIQCKTGHYNLCDTLTFFSHPPVHGSLCRYVAHDAELCYKIPDHMTLEEGALMEPLAVAVQACRRGDIQLGQKVLVTGTGPIGVVCMLAARAQGAGRVVMTDLNDERLQLAKDLGADHVINVRHKTIAQVREEVISALGEEPAVTIECAGATSCLETAISTTRSGGVIVMVGLGAPTADLHLIDAAIREIDIRGVFRYANCYPVALELIASGRLDLSGITRAHYTLEESVEAFERSQKGDVIKTFIHC